MKLTDLLSSTRKKYGRDSHLRESNGVRQVIWFASSKLIVERDSSVVVVKAETRGQWKDLEVRT